MKPNYQTIPDLAIFGRFNTPDEFDRIRLPKDLTSKTVLDIGCNEGAFVFECVKRGALVATGVDVDKEWIQRAEQARNNLFQVTDANRMCTFIEHDALTFVREYRVPFDLILCLSVTHLIEDPNGLVLGCMNLLHPGGLLILEINHRLEKEKVDLASITSRGFGFKIIGENKDGRTVYHITKNNL